eukprot:3812363-Prymnesium_polylepis.1
MRLLPRICQQGGVFMDSGANEGIYTLPAARLGCRVVAVEVQRRCTVMLRAACAHKGFECSIHQLALSPQPIAIQAPTRINAMGPGGWIATATPK